MQAKKSGGSNHQIVIGPDTGEDIGDAPTRAMPALPSFDAAGVTLDNISTNANKPLPDPAERGGVVPNDPMSVHGTHPMNRGPAGPALPTKPAGFGENTLLWMQPPKPPPEVHTGATGDIIPKVDPKVAAVRKLKTFGALAIIGVVIAGLLFVTMRSPDKGVLELHTNPPKAKVAINGRLSTEVTPMKLTLPEGTYDIEISLDGYQPHRFTTQIVGGDKVDPIRKDIDLEPISREGLYTISISISPIAANITLDDTVHAGKRTLKIPNVDPNKPHKIVVEAGGYVKIEQDIPVGQLKQEYSFALQKEDK